MTRPLNRLQAAFVIARRDYVATVATTDFDRPVDVLQNGTNPLRECLYAVFEEEFWHNRYARRDLARLEAVS